jgi:hypothetical protein
LRKLAWSALGVLLIGAVTAAGVLVIGGSEGDDRRDPAPGDMTASEEAPTGGSRSPTRLPDPEGNRAVRRQVREAVGQSPAARLDPAQRQVARTVRAYVAALDRGDGARACRLLAPGALSVVRLPRHRGDCGRSLSASIGYRDPRGFPVFAGAQAARVAAVALDGSEARVTATTVTRFAGRREPSVEDDVIYLQRGGGRWLVEKPGVILYRAIGVGDIPPQVLAPP